jgi:hypothetical protein
MSDSKQAFAWAAITLVVIAVGAGLYAAGSPKEARLYLQDERRIEALEQASYAVRGFYDSHKQVPSPDSLLARHAGDTTWFRDRVTGKPFEYESLTVSTYRLCAEFDRPSEDGIRAGNAVWKHPAGRHCFDRSIRSE